MKKYSLILILTALLAGCKDSFFNTDSPSAMDEKSVFSSARETEQVIAGIYTILGEQNSYRSRLGGYWTSYNTDIEMYNGSAPSYCSYSMTKDGHSDLTAKDKHPWVYLTSAIERANLCINGIEQYGDTTSSEIRYLWGEALTLRAWLYYEMIKLWGDVPYNFEPLDVNTTSSIYVTKCDRRKIFDKLRIDLRKAIELMPFSQEITWGVANNNVERMNKQFACGLLARIDLVYAGKALRPDTWQEGGGSSCSVGFLADESLRQELLDETIRYTEMVMEYDGIEIGGKLNGSFENVFRNICANVKEYRKTETLWEIPFANNVRGQFLNRMGAYVNKTALGHLVNTTSTSKSNAKITLTPSFVLSFTANDTRRFVTGMPCEWCYDNANNDDFSIFGVESGDSILYQKTDKAKKVYLSKFRYEWLNYDVTGDEDGLNIPIMRYSDILLMYAEASIGGVTEVTPTYRGKWSAQEIFNIVRSRAGVEPINNPTMEDIMSERAKEFCGEYIRKYDLMRWGIFDTKLKEAQIQLDKFTKKSGDKLDLSGTEYEGHINEKIYVKYEQSGDFGKSTMSYQIVDIYGLALDELGAPEGYVDSEENGGWIQTDFWMADGSPALKGQRIYAASVESQLVNRQYWPIFTIILSSNPYLWNDYNY